MDFISIVVWWAYILLIGAVFLPLAILIFPKFYDKGYLFAKTLGIAIMSYIVWLLASIKFVPFSRVTIFIIFIFSAIVMYGLFRRNSKMLETLKSKAFIKTIAIQEGMFFVTLCFWSFLRGLKPDIEGLEKFMDLGFVNTILKSEYMPPQDMWFAGEYINYYYYGHYITAFLTRLTGISSYVTYNIMMATLFAFSFVLSFSLVSNLLALFSKTKLGHRIWGGIVSALLMALGGNLHVIVFGYILPAMKKMGVKFDSGLEIRDRYWFPDATRYIGHNPDRADRTIHEFPFYSFVVSDLHAHVINVPFVITIIALCFSFLLWVFETGRDKVIDGEKPYTMISVHVIIAGFLIGLFQMTNYWDFPIYLTVLMLTYFYVYLIKYDFKIKAYIYTALTGIAVLVFSMLVALPFSANFHNFSNGIKLSPTRTALYQLLIVWGYQFFFAIWVIIYVIKGQKEKIIKLGSTGKKKKKSHRVDWGVKNEEKGFWVYIKRRLSEITLPEVFVFVLAISALGLILIPEIIYVKDIYNPPHHRANTMFKLTYQSFMMFSLVAGYALIRIINIRRDEMKYLILKIIAVMLVIIPMIYPLHAIESWYGEMKMERYKGLDGMNFLVEKHPDDYEVVKWFNQNIKGQPTILEANGDSYTMYGRISMSTGLPTILGWYVHEWLWHNDNTIVSKRVEEVKTIYESEDVAATKRVIEKYGVKYVVVGELEREKFKELKEEKLLSFGSKVFESQNTFIIKVE